MRKPIHTYLRAIAVMMMSMAAVSCIKDDAESADREVYINATISTYANYSSDNNSLGDAEYVIKSYRLYAFDGERLDNMVYVGGLDNSTGTQTVRMKVKQTTTKKLYCIINEPDVLAVHGQLALINNPAAFTQIEYTLVDYLNKSGYGYSDYGTEFAANKFCLPMFGQTAVFSTINANPAVDVNAPGLSVDRAVARVDVFLQSESIGAAKIDATTKFGILNTRATGYISDLQTALGSLIPIANAATGPATAYTVPTRAGSSGYTNAVRVFSFYTPERSHGVGSELGVTMTGVDCGGTRKDFTMKIVGSSLNKIERNKVHKLIGTFKENKVSIDLTTAVEGWSARPQNVIFDQQYFLRFSASSATFPKTSTGITHTVTVETDYVKNVAQGAFHESGIFIDLTGKPAWLTVTPSGANGDAPRTIELKAADNSTGAQRTGSFTIKAGNMSYTFKVTQTNTNY